jgi:hypothetical protein
MVSPHAQRGNAISRYTYTAGQRHPRYHRREAGCGVIVKLYRAFVLLYGTSFFIYTAGDLDECPAASDPHRERSIGGISTKHRKEPCHQLG